MRCLLTLALFAPALAFANPPGPLPAPVAADGKRLVDVQTYPGLPGRRQVIETPGTPGRRVFVYEETLAPPPTVEQRIAAPAAYAPPAYAPTWPAAAVTMPSYAPSYAPAYAVAPAAPNIVINVYQRRGLFGGGRVAIRAGGRSREATAYEVPQCAR